MAYGVLSTGFAVKPRPTCLEEVIALARSIFGEGINTDASGPWGQFLGILADRESEVWDLAQAVYASRDPNQATGSSLETICALTSTTKKAATKSQIAEELLFGTAATVVPAVTVLSVSGTGVKFVTKAAATITAATAWAISTAYTVGQRRTNSGNIYEVTVAGTSAASGGPTGTGTAIVDGTVTWRYRGIGTAFASVAVEGQDTGPKAAPGGTLTVIETPVSGLSSAVNPLDATLGTDIETDAALRLRRVSELAIAGDATTDAIRAEVLKVTGVTACTVFRNATMVTDGNGLPAKSVEVLVSGGADADIRSAIWNSAAGGIETYGSVSGTVTDASGNAQTVKFSRPTEVLVYLVVNLEKTAATWPSDGVAQVQAQLVAWGAATLAAGVDLVSWAMKRAITVSGVMNISSLYLGTAPSPTSEAKLGVTSRQIAKLDTSRISVVPTDFSETP